MCDLFGDDAAAEANFAGIEDGGLPRGGALDRPREREAGSRFGVVGILTDRTVSFWASGNLAVDERGAVAEANLEAVWVIPRRFGREFSDVFKGAAGAKVETFEG